MIKLQYNVIGTYIRKATELYLLQGFFLAAVIRL